MGSPPQPPGCLKAPQNRHLVERSGTTNGLWSMDCRGGERTRGGGLLLDAPPAPLSPPVGGYRREIGSSDTHPSGENAALGVHMGCSSQLSGAGHRGEGGPRSLQKPRRCTLDLPPSLPRHHHHHHHCSTVKVNFSCSPVLSLLHSSSCLAGPTRCLWRLFALCLRSFFFDRRQ